MAAIFVAGMLVIIGLVAGGWVKSQFFPEVEGDILSAKLEMPPGNPFEGTESAVLQIERAALRVGREVP